MKKTIDINVDVGEGSGFDKELMPLVSSCNVASGGHFGDSFTMRETMKLAKKYDVKIGAHPSYPDPDNFGREVMNITSEALKNSIRNQLTCFFEIAAEQDVEVHHVKLHGALYNRSIVDSTVATAIVEVLDELSLNCALYLPYGSQLHTLTKESYPLYFEAFIDRRYHSDLTLVSRLNPRGLIFDKNEAWNQLHEMVYFGKVSTIENVERSIEASTFCIHGDTDGAVEILKFIRRKMNDLSMSL
ncbi:MAG: LamB/YcsF family protein [Bacteroidetes bacterium]|nr:LamB/YcsF family protein [Bacteroidota bacterium]